MELILYRDEFSKVTIGSLYADGQFCCHTLEPHAIDWAREKKSLAKQPYRRVHTVLSIRHLQDSVARCRSCSTCLNSMA